MNQKNAGANDVVACIFYTSFPIIKKTSKMVKLYYHGRIILASNFFVKMIEIVTSLLSSFLSWITFFIFTFKLTFC